MGSMSGVNRTLGKNPTPQGDGALTHNQDKTFQPIKAQLFKDGFPNIRAWEPNG